MLDQDEIKRRKFKDWFQLNSISRKVYSSLKENNVDEFSEHILEYVSISYETNVKEIESLFWFDIATAFQFALELNQPTLRLPMFIFKEKKDSLKEVSYNFDYEEREWYVFLHLFSKTYGWSVTEIENLDVDDGLALIQEIRLQEQLDKEFTYSLSEIAYPYNESRKVHEFKPLERPEWMKEYVKVLPPKKIMIRIDMLPVGLIVKSPNNNAIN